MRLKGYTDPRERDSETHGETNGEETQRRDRPQRQTNRHRDERRGDPQEKTDRERDRQTNGLRDIQRVESVSNWILAPCQPHRVSLRQDEHKLTDRQLDLQTGRPADRQTDREGGGKGREEEGGRR